MTPPIIEGICSANGEPGGMHPQRLGKSDNTSSPGWSIQVARKDFDLETRPGVIDHHDFVKLDNSTCSVRRLKAPSSAEDEIGDLERPGRT